MSEFQPPLQISNQTARRFILDHHFLLPPRQLNPDEILSKIFSRLGCIQFDTINVVGRNADLALQSRVKGYSSEILKNLLYRERKLIDGWDKMASIYQTTDWPYFRRRREQMKRSHQQRSAEAAKATSDVLDAIKSKGALSSIDFDDNRKTDWWWAPTSVTRAAMETLYGSGELGIHHRVNTRRVFDLTEKLIPADILSQPDPHNSESGHLRWHLLRRIGSMGLSSPRSGEFWLGIIGGRKVSERKPGFDEILSRGLITQVTIESIPGQIFYLRTDDFQQFQTTSRENLQEPRAAFIAPLDNLIWNRKLIKDLFHFQYTWEVYKPKVAREYGYYVLPVLYGDRFIARVEMKFDRKTNILLLIDWWWEKGIQRTPEMESAIQAAFREFLHFTGGDRIQLITDNFTAKRQASLFRQLTGARK